MAVLFVRQGGFPRRWAALQTAGGRTLGIISQEHEGDNEGKSVFSYRAVLLPSPDLGLFATLKGAKQAIRAALDA